MIKKYVIVAGLLNDLWQWDPASAWTWLGGSDQTWNAGNYGSYQVANVTNLPPSRLSHSMTYSPVLDALVVFGGIVALGIQCKTFK